MSVISDAKNIFQEVLTDVNNVETKLLGPAYPYYQNIKSPSQIGMSSDGNLSTLAQDIDGLVSYVELLVSGSGAASATGQPLGNKFFKNRCEMRGYRNESASGSIHLCQ